MTISEETKRSIQIAQSLAREYHNERFGPAHLLQAVLHNEAGLASWLVSHQKDIHYMREWAEIRMEQYPKSARSTENPSADDTIAPVLELSDLIALQLNRHETDALCMLTALLKPALGFSQDQLKSFPLTQKEVMDLAVEDQHIEQALQPEPDQPSQNGKPAGAGNALYKYCVDKTAMAEEGRLDPIIGRDKELRMMLEVLGRRTKPNVIIVGEPGVGKTALIDGFARLIAEGKATTHLQKARLFELDTGALVAGASYKGEVEERIKNIIKEIKQFEKAVLFIDEIHQLLDSKGAIGTGVVNLLKPELARGELTVLGATTNEEYRKYFEADQAFSRRFELVRVEEPDTDTAINMLQHVVGLYEKHHNLAVDLEALHEAVHMSKRYAKDRKLPDSAVDIMDRTMSAIKMMGDTSLKELEAVKTVLDKIVADNDEQLLPKLKWCHRELKDKISPILLNKMNEAYPEQDQDLEIPDVLSAHLFSVIDKLISLAAEKKDTVTKYDIAAMISYKTGIPLGKIQSKEKEKLLTAEEILKKRVIGQDHAIKSVSEAILESRSGLIKSNQPIASFFLLGPTGTGKTEKRSDRLVAFDEAILESRSGLIKSNQPIASFFLLGPTGTGKTELAKSLADFLFNDESFLLRFDMSEFKEEHSVALLYGAPPGYAGYQEGGMLVNKIREKPYSVVLFDEIEKAHPSVFDVFLQILDEGKLHDKLGKEGDFSNAIVLFTSNIGSEFIAEKFNNGTIPTPTDMMEIMSRYFRPEFLARLTEIVPFSPILEENVVRIFDIHLRSLTEPLSRQGVTLNISPEARRHLSLSGFTPKYGARQIKSVIRNQLRRPISRRIISGELSKGTTIHLHLGESEQLEWQLQH